MAPQQRLPRVALCLAGAWRNLTYYRAVWEHIVSPTNASVFVAHSNDEALYHGKLNRSNGKYAGKVPSAFVTATDFQNLIGRSLHGTVVWDHSALLSASWNSLARWAGALVANMSGLSGDHPPALVMNWIWHLKRWACVALVAADGPYDIVITSRPDIVPTRPWSFHRALGVPGKLFSLTVGDETPVHFGEKEIVMSDWLNFDTCINDQIAVSTFHAAITLEQLIQHAFSSYAFLPENRGGCPKRGETGKWPWATNCCEAMLGTYLWRVGIERQLANLQIILPGLRNATGMVDRGLCGLPEFARYGQLKMRVPHSSKGLAGHGTPGLATKALSRCPASRLPTCPTYVDLLQPLKPCERHSHQHLVNVTSGYGQGFPWWHLCPNDFCDPLPNTTFYFSESSADGTLEAASVFAYRGRAIRHDKGGLVTATPTATATTTPQGHRSELQTGTPAIPRTTNRSRSPAHNWRQG